MILTLDDAQSLGDELTEKSIDNPPIATKIDYSPPNNNNKDKRGGVARGNAKQTALPITMRSANNPINISSKL